MLPVLATLAGVFLCSIAAGCSSGSGVDAGGEICGLSMPLSGGLSANLGADGCGSAGNNILVFDDLAFGNGGGSTNVEITFPGSAIPVDQTGTFSTTIRLTHTLGDGGSESWSTPDAACSVTIAGSICSPTSVFSNRRVLSGSGTCSQPAAPEMGTSAAAVTIGKFTYEGFINPM